MTKFNGIDTETGLPKGTLPQTTLADQIRSIKEIMDVSLQSGLPMPQLKKLLISESVVRELFREGFYKIDFKDIPGFDFQGFKEARGVLSLRQEIKVAKSIAKDLAQWADTEGLTCTYTDHHTLISGVLKFRLK